MDKLKILAPATKTALGGKMLCESVVHSYSSKYGRTRNIPWKNYNMTESLGGTYIFTQ